MSAHGFWAYPTCSLPQQLKELETERDHLRQQMGQLQESFHQQQAAIAELQSKVEAASVAAQESSR